MITVLDQQKKFNFKGMISKQLKAVIIEDEQESLQLLHNLIIANGNVELTGS
jgi:hypothetical protein